jgi:hypothetical protein
MELKGGLAKWKSGAMASTRERSDDILDRGRSI